MSRCIFPGTGTLCYTHLMDTTSDRIEVDIYTTVMPMAIVVNRGETPPQTGLVKPELVAQGSMTTEEFLELCDAMQEYSQKQETIFSVIYQYTQSLLKAARGHGNTTRNKPFRRDHPQGRNRHHK